MKEVSDNDGNEEEDHDAVDGDDDGCPEDHGGTWRDCLHTQQLQDG